MFKRLAAAGLAVLLIAAPALSTPVFLTPEEMQGITLEQRLPVEGVKFEHWGEEELPNAGFLPGGTYCMTWFCVPVSTTLIFMGDWKDTPYEMRLAVFLHELGHYVQYLEGRDFDEWDADVYSANEMCKRGYDGFYWTWRWLAHFSEKYDRDWNYTSDSHGSAAGRLRNVERKAEDCYRFGVQA